MHISSLALSIPSILDDAHELNLRKIKKRKGLLLIASLSGFTNFTRQTELTVGLKMSKRFLQAIQSIKALKKA